MARMRKDRTPGAANCDRANERSRPRSLGAALREAGLGEAAPASRTVIADAPPLRSYGEELSSAIAASRSPPLAVFDTEHRQPEAEPLVTPTFPSTQGVVSPPPWLRAARRGRWHARMINTFGWVMTLVIAGSIIGLAGHYLGLSPASIQTTLQARP